MLQKVCATLGISVSQIRHNGALPRKVGGQLLEIAPGVKHVAWLVS